MTDKLMRIIIIVGVLFHIVGLHQFGWGQRFAFRTSNHSLGVTLSLTGPTQEDVNKWVSSLAQVGTKELSGGFELGLDYLYRFDRSIFSVLFRPGYLTQRASGGDVTTSLTALSFFPIFRFYPLESQYIQFFMQVGVGYASVDLSLENGAIKGSYQNSAFGALAGIGVNFCINAHHCFVVEGNLRYLPIQRLEGTAS
ncbi:MAG: hypothetical protein NZ480_02975, partial [Bdellovibrionaceae bacterium]|nr:hypothetical protein [Pseudobdellovibrionaceae bacterium]